MTKINDRCKLSPIFANAVICYISYVFKKLYTLSTMIDVAITAARTAGDLAYTYFKKNLKVPYKADNSPVTLADIEAEKLIRKIITKNFPDHGIIGEELENVNPKAKYQWVIDPIDGTKRFSIGHLYWSVLIAVLENNKPIIGISFFPATNEFFLAQKGKGTYLNGKRVKVSTVKSLVDSFVVYGSMRHFSKIDKVDQVIKLLDLTRMNLGDGHSVGHNFLLKGKVEASFETGNLWDFAAPSILVEEAGGKFTDFSGKNSLISGNALFSNGNIHSEILKILSE